MIEKLTTQLAQSNIFQDAYVPHEDLEAQISSLSFEAVMWGGLALLVLMIIARLVNDRVPKLKKPLFLATIFTVLSVTLLLIGSTIYLNTNSESGGPVHWHADFEMWACGQELELRNPTGTLSNKIGSPSLHEHNDKRIHLEGVLVEPRDASLGKFFYVIDGGISENAIRIPLNADGPYFDDRDMDYEVDEDVRSALVREYVNQSREGDNATFINGQTCPGGETAEMQVFAYQVAEDENGNTVEEDGKKVFYQTKIDDPVNYIINDDSEVPPGDCLIFEFAPLKSSTDKICRQFEVVDTGRTIINEDGEEVESRGEYIYKGMKDDSQDATSQEDNEASSEENYRYAEQHPNFDEEKEAECRVETNDSPEDPSTDCADYFTSIDNLPTWEELN